MSLEAVWHVERWYRSRNAWQHVDRWAHAVRCRGRSLWPNEPLTDARLAEAEGVLMLEVDKLPSYVQWHVKHWEVPPDYDLFAVLCGYPKRPRRLPMNTIAAARGLPDDASPESRAAAQRVDLPEDQVDVLSPSWLTLEEMSVLREERAVLRSPMFMDFARNVLEPMSSVHVDPHRVRAVFWFSG